MASLNNILPGGFDAQAVEPQSGGGAVPAGIYDVEITGSEIKDAKSGNGTGLKLEYTIVGPTHAGRKIFGYLNLRHTNEQAEQIGQSQLSALCRAVGINKLLDSDELFGKIVRVRVKIRPARDGYEESNDVTAWESAGAGTPPPAATRAAPPAAAKTMPWQKRA